MQGGGDFPGSQVPIREGRQILPYIVLAVILVIAGLFTASVWLNWTILQYMFSVKAGLDWFGINFYGGLTFVVAAFLALLFINPFSRRSDLFEAINALMGLQYRQPTYGGAMPRRVRPIYIRPSRMLWGFWQFLKWIVLFALFAANNGFPGFGNLSMIVDMASKGFGSWSLVPRMALLPLDPASSTGIISLVPTMEIQFQIVAYVLQVFLVVIGVRFFLKFLRDVVIRAGDKWLRNVFVTLSAVALSVFFTIPYWAMNVDMPYVWGAVVTVLATFVGLAMFFQLRSSKETIPIMQRRRLGVIIVSVVIVGILAVNLGAVAYYGLNFNNNYINYLWTPQVSKQVAVSSWAAGVSNITQSNINGIPQGNASITLSLIRNWDTQAAQTQSQNQLGVNYLQLNTPSIVYVHGQEYWVSTTTFSYPNPGDWRAVHLIYTHSSKIIVMNTHTGEFVPVTKAFGIPKQPLVYYGIDNPTSSGFSNDVYVGVAQAPPEIENVTYSGAPDYTLCGAQRGLWFLEQGQLGYAFSPPQNCIAMLHDREVFQRVQNVLISGLVEDGTSYLVTDGTNLYFAIQVYIDYPLHSGFANVPHTTIQNYMRFFGVVLVNVANGEMQGYTMSGNDNFLTSFYKEYYPTWGAVPSWLQPQLRYPEQLLGNQQFAGQLDADFVDHLGSSLADASNFLSGSLFYERPNSTEVLYIPLVVGNNVSFSAVQLVEYTSSLGKNLAGLYVVYGGDQLGQMYLYQTNSTAIQGIPLLGPSAALSAFNTDPQTKTQVTLTQATPGNILLYPVQGHLYYFIPAYIQQKTGTSVVEKNPFVDVIDAQNSSQPVRLISTNSSLISTYGFSGIGTTFTNSTERIQYLNSLFTGSGVSLQNSTISTVNIIDHVGSAIFQTEGENPNATAFVNNFINSYVLNSSVTQGKLAFGAVFYWIPSPGTINYGFVVSDLGVTKMYYISLTVGTA